jgi:hypothetical protein
VAGLVGGLVILAVDRLLVVAMRRRAGWRRIGAVAVPRLLLAVLLAFLVSTPLVLQIFDFEVRAQLAAEQSRQIAEIVGAEATGDTASDRTDELQARIAELENPAQDADVLRLTEQVAAAQAETDRLAVQVGCEVGGSGQGCTADTAPGEGPLLRENRRLLSESQSRLTDLQNQLVEATAAEQENVRLAEENPASELNGARAELAALVVGRRTQLDVLSLDTGLSSRLDALVDLGEVSPGVVAVHWILTALFTVVGALPVLATLVTARTQAEHRPEPDRAQQLDREVAT